MKKVFLKFLLLIVLVNSVFSSGDGEDELSSINYINIEGINGSPVINVSTVEEFIQLATKYEITEVFIQIKNDNSFNRRTSFSFTNEGVVYRTNGYNYYRLDEAYNGIANNIYDDFLYKMLNDFNIGMKKYSEINKYGLITPESLRYNNNLIEKSVSLELPRELNEKQYTEYFLPLFASIIIEDKRRSNRFIESNKRFLPLSSSEINNIPFYLFVNKKEESNLNTNIRSHQRNSKKVTDEIEDKLYFNYYKYKEVLALLKSDNNVLNLYEYDNIKKNYYLTLDSDNKKYFEYIDSNVSEYYLIKLINSLNPDIGNEVINELIAWKTLEYDRYEYIKELSSRAGLSCS